MAEIHGKGGLVMVGSDTVASIDSWTLTVDAEMADITAFGDDDRKFLPGLRNATASISGSYNHTTSSTGQDDIQDEFSSTGTVSSYLLKLLTINTTAATSGFVGTAYFTNLSIGDDIGDKVTFSANAQFSGGVKRGTSTST